MVGRLSFLNRLLTFFGVFGLKHEIMFNNALLKKEILAAGFEIIYREKTPSAKYRLNDGSLHIFAKK